MSLPNPPVSCASSRMSFRMCPCPCAWFPYPPPSRKCTASCGICAKSSTSRPSSHWWARRRKLTRPLWTASATPSCTLSATPWTMVSRRMSRTASVRARTPLVRLLSPPGRPAARLSLRSGMTARASTMRPYCARPSKTGLPPPMWSTATVKSSTFSCLPASPPIPR